MVKYFCDECGKEIEQEEHKKHKITFYEYTKNESGGYRGPTGPTHTYKTLLSIYLCNECYKKLQKQFNIGGGK